MSRSSLSRRDFMRLSCCSAAGAAMAAGMGRFGLVNAYAQSSGPYKALVCIFLFGGNDGNNMLIPFDAAGYAAYSSARVPIANGGLAFLQGSLLSITPGANPQPYSAFALHPNMSGVQGLYNSGKLAFVSNVGTLIQPVTKAQYIAHTQPVPSALFSHSDQQNQWQTSVGNSNSPTGWAGRAADKTQSLNPQPQAIPTIVSVAGANIFATGVQTRPATASVGQQVAFQGFNLGNPPDAGRYQAMQDLLTFDSGVSLVQAAGAITGFSVKDSQALVAALGHGTPLNTVFPNSGIAAQLKQVAQIIQVRALFSPNPLNRQIYFCSMGGYDTHSNQLNDQGNLLGQLSAAMNAFYNATVELGVSSQVTTFTLSEFGRTLQFSASGAAPGSDHAWGNHQMVMGGAVHGGDVYGTFPTLAVGGPDDTGNAGARGRWIPTTSLDQYAATLASWFGVADADLQPYVFPDLANFAPQKLTFMG